MQRFAEMGLEASASIIPISAVESRSGRKSSAGVEGKRPRRKPTEREPLTEAEPLLRSSRTKRDPKFVQTVLEHDRVVDEEEKGMIEEVR